MSLNTQPCYSDATQGCWSKAHAAAAHVLMIQAGLLHVTVANGSAERTLEITSMGVDRIHSLPAGHCET